MIMEDLFITTKIVQSHTKLNTSAAQRKLAKVRKAYGIPKYGDVNIFLYCKYYRMEVDDFMHFMDELKKKEDEMMARKRQMKLPVWLFAIQCGSML